MFLLFAVNYFLSTHCNNLPAYRSNFQIEVALLRFGKYNRCGPIRNIDIMK